LQKKTEKQQRGIVLTARPKPEQQVHSRGKQCINTVRYCFEQDGAQTLSRIRNGAIAQLSFTTTKQKNRESSVNLSQKTGFGTQVVYTAMAFCPASINGFH